MKKILIIGHNQANNEHLESLFQKFGMNKALPSRREGLTPIQIGELLNKVIKLQVSQEKSINVDGVSLPKKLPTNISKRRFKKALSKRDKNFSTASQMIPKSTWDYIPMDLLIANVDNEFWGWADKNAIDHLEYWKEIDPSILFVFAYDHPESIFFELNNRKEIASKEEIVESIKDWNEYNSKFLLFLEKNPDNIIIVNNERLHQQEQISIKSICSRVIPDYIGKNNGMSIPSYSEQREYRKLPSSLSVIVSNIISSFPGIASTYNKLQDISHLPFYNSSSENTISIDEHIDAWIDANLRERELNSVLSLNETLNFQNKKYDAKLNLSNKEKELLISQVYNLQEEIEKVYLDNSKLKKINLDFSKKDKAYIDELSKKDKEINNLNKLNLKLEQDYSELEKAKERISDDNKLLLEELYVIQEKMEHNLYSDTKRNTTCLVGASNIIRNQIKYKLGALMIKQSKSFLGMLTLPLQLSSTYKREIKLEINNINNLEEYVDFYDAEKLKKHLSYRLGDVFVQNFNNPFKCFILPFKLIHTSFDFKRKIKK
ncbi:MULTISPECIES: hypothetical protein [Glaesserella]|uniref:Uncharacterized protein n=1 Tax=Glaesserella australis TaxID=2094024 RepID=A0A328C2T7_9PAST|nr:MULTISPECIES: hypothetical protein [Glaesserella]AUI66416.1 hypothetical protein CJD39_07385 [Glaesserella sp. 15-184]RAL19370.1 hypothetical protein C5N92_02680 [Glaesserella australis]